MLLRGNAQPWEGVVMLGVSGWVEKTNTYEALTVCPTLV